jgi:hypothetical protein
MPLRPAPGRGHPHQCPRVRPCPPGRAHEEVTMQATCRIPRVLDIPGNPKGIESFSPGLRGTSYPGCAIDLGVNPERVASSIPSRRSTPRHGREPTGRGGDATLTIGLVGLWMLEPRVARASQPWAQCSHPFRMMAKEGRRLACPTTSAGTKPFWRAQIRRP